MILVAPLDGWCSPLEEVPDPVFSGQMMGDGVAIDPTSATLCSPCDAEVVTVAVARHAVTLRAKNGGQRGLWSKLGSYRIVSSMLTRWSVWQQQGDCLQALAYRPERRIAVFAAA